MIILSGRTFLILTICLCSIGLAGQEKRAMELTDIMKFKQLRSPPISQDGEWLD